MTTSKPSVDDDARDAFVARFAKRVPVKADAQVIDDIKHFAKRAAEGQEISITGLLDFFKQHRGIEFKRYRLATIARESGIEPWWAA